MSYRTLKQVFHMFDEGRATEEEQARRSSLSAIHWDFQVADAKLFCLVTPEVTALVERIMLREAQTRTEWERLPLAVKRHYLRNMVIEEIQSTNEIESVHSTRKEISDALEAVDSGSSTGSRRFQEMARLYLAIGEGGGSVPQTLRDLKDVYDKVMGGEVPNGDAPDGELFRAGPVTIIDGQKTVHSGSRTEEEINAGLREMLRQSKDENIPHLIRAVVAHFMFEFVHPFYDGNGRTGRYLLALDLGKILSPVAWLALSATIADGKSAYYKAFTEAEEPRNSGDVTPFVIAMLELVAESEGRLLDDIRHLNDQMMHLDQRIRELDEAQVEHPRHLTSESLDVLYVIAQATLFGPVGVVTLDELVNVVKKSTQFVRARTKELEAEGLVETRSQRPLKFIVSAAGRELLEMDE